MRSGDLLVELDAAELKATDRQADAAVVQAYNVGLPFETEVLHSLDLSVLRGEFCAVVGPSGSGKSTLLNIVGLLDRPTSGTLEVCGGQLLLADEPTGNLHTKSADEVFGLLRRFNTEHGTTVLFVTHNAELAGRCDKTIEVIDGRLTG